MSSGNAEDRCIDVQDLQPQLIKTVGEVEALMVRIAKEKAEVVQPKAAAVAVDEAAAQAKVSFNTCHQETAWVLTLAAH